ncbi:hypothetical protein BCR34DRAFT_576595 [Clohesyomyces aquaticus]|uniref:F-box domain-containing protein n=1 Tax=Clohesyomyces aquaticus TaxID=1231657 RepID=A0A1Y1YNB4_9PLEO|nr:hypothetical protein BCR34DRAFT_576595 [Clohesyomyces aquaticus]
MSTTPSSPMQATTFHRWPDLPEELQLLILEHRLVLPSPITRNKHSTYSRMLLEPLIRTRKWDWKLSHTARKVYYESNIFLLKHEHRNFWVPKPEVSRLIRHLQVFIDVFPHGIDQQPYDNSLRNSNSPFLFLPRPGPDETTRPTTWEDGFKNLHSLKIIVNIPWVACFANAYGQSRFRVLQLFLHGKEIKLRARKVVVEVHISCYASCNCRDWVRDAVLALFRQEVELGPSSE